MRIVTLMILSVLLYWIAVPRRWRGIFLLLASLGFISFLSPVYALYFLLMSVFVYLAALFMKKNERLFLPVLILLIANLCFYKYFRVGFDLADSVLSRFFGAPFLEVPEIIFPIGLSFITFRLIHYLVEARRNNVPAASFTAFALYVLFFPTFLAGPVERFPVFHGMTEGMGRLTIKELNYGLWRILSGVVKKFLIADSMLPLILPIIRFPSDHSRGAVILAVYGAAIWLYMGFGGYTDMAIGVSRLFGYRIIENFNRPFLRGNIALYWRNWHISVYSWIRDYFYFPFFASRGTYPMMYIGIFLTMMVFMLWHAPTAGFFFAGVYNGVGLIGWKLFRDFKERRTGLRHIFDHRFLDPLAVAVTFTYVSLGIAIAFMGNDAGNIYAVLKKVVGG